MMKSLRSEEEKVVKDIRNLFRRKKKKRCAAIKGLRFTLDST